MKLLTTLNPEHVPDQEANEYPVREAARAVVIDDQGRVALLHVTRDGYYKIPGGGVEKGENHHMALQRECLEEIGTRVKVVGEIGMIIENRKFCSLKQISYCYFAQQIGDQGQPNFMPDEIEEGFEAVWLPYETALRVLTNNEAVGLEGHSYIVPRDVLFLQAAKKYIQRS